MLSSSSYEDEDAEVMDIEADDQNHENNEREDNELYYTQMATIMKGLMQDLGLGDGDDSSSTGGEGQSGNEDDDKTLLECDGHSHCHGSQNDSNDSNRDKKECANSEHHWGIW